MQADSSEPMEARRRRWLGRIVLLLVAAAIAVSFDLIEPLIAGLIWLVESFPKKPLLSSLILLAVGLVFVLCIFGTRLQSPRAVSFLCRLFLMVITLTVGLISVELLFLGATVASLQGMGLEGYLLLVGALALVFVAAAGIKIALALRTPYWIVLLVVSAPLAGLMVFLSFS